MKKSLRVAVPFGDTSKDLVQNFAFPFMSTGRTGWKIGYLIEWNCKASLTHCRSEVEQQAFDVSRETAARNYANAIA